MSSPLKTICSKCGRLIYLIEEIQNRCPYCNGKIYDDNKISTRDTARQDDKSKD